jgi:hypothetical protein
MCRSPHCYCSLSTALPTDVVIQWDSFHMQIVKCNCNPALKCRLYICLQKCGSEMESVHCCWCCRRGFIHQPGLWQLTYNLRARSSPLNFVLNLVRTDSPDTTQWPGRTATSCSDTGAAACCADRLASNCVVCGLVLTVTTVAGKVCFCIITVIIIIILVSRYAFTVFTIYFPSNYFTEAWFCLGVLW